MLAKARHRAGFFMPMRGVDMALLLQIKDAADVVSAPFSSNDQPCFVMIHGTFKSPQAWMSRGFVRVEYQTHEGEWRPMAEMTYQADIQDPFRLPPGVNGRIVVSGCSSVSVEVHDNAAVEV